MLVSIFFRSDHNRMKAVLCSKQTRQVQGLVCFVGTQSSGSSPGMQRPYRQLLWLTSVLAIAHAHMCLSCILCCCCAELSCRSTLVLRMCCQAWRALSPSSCAAMHSSWQERSRKSEYSCVGLSLYSQHSSSCHTLSMRTNTCRMAGTLRA